MKTNNNNPDKITLAEAKSALLRSGYLLENRVEKILSENDYFVEANTVYQDPTTQKSRELDVYAAKSHSYKERFSFWVRSHLLVECVNNPQPIAFITKEVEYPQFLKENIKLTGMPKTVKNNDSSWSKEFPWVAIEDFLEMQEYHHYCSGKIATQFCSFVKKKNSSEWMAFHEDSHFEAFEKLCNVVNFHSAKVEKDLANPTPKTVRLHCFYPLIIVEGELLEIKVGKKTSLQKTKHIQFARGTIQNNEPTNYQIDVITESYLKNYLKLIENEMVQTIQRIQEEIDPINESIKELTKISF